MMKFISAALILGFSASVFAANTCQNYTNYAWGLEKIADKDLAKVTRKYRNYNCKEVSAGAAVKFAQKAYNMLSCQPEGDIRFASILDLDSRYEVCRGTYNYYNWVEEDIFVIKDLDNADENLVFAGGWEE